MAARAAARVVRPSLRRGERVVQNPRLVLPPPAQNRSMRRINGP
jgi:hypothetical protein